jgi:hypothetical protein
MIKTCKVTREGTTLVATSARISVEPCHQTQWQYIYFDTELKVYVAVFKDLGYTPMSYGNDAGTAISTNWIEQQRQQDAFMLHNILGTWE